MTSSLIANSRRAFVRALVVACGLAVAFDAAAFNISGHVINATTGKGIAAEILVVNPSGGMLVENTVHTLDDDGYFEAPDLDGAASVYLLRVMYDGVNYTEIVRTAGGDATIEINVYERTSSWDDISISIPHLIVTRSNDSLYVERFYSIQNLKDPPKTLAGEPFVFHLPADMLSLGSVYVMSLGVPVPADPEPASEPGFLQIDYPIRPGETQVVISMALPYVSDQYVYREQLRYDTDEVFIMLADPTMRVSQAGVSLEHAEDSHGFTTYRAAGQAAGSELVVTFTGGASVSVRPTGAVPASGAGGTVMIVANRTNAASYFYMFLVALLLMVLLAIGSRSDSQADTENEVIQAQRERLLQQVARLDDLHKAGAVADRVYELKRNELIASLAQIYYRTQFEQDPDDGNPNKGAASV